jgi:hypothetical protein
VRLRGVRLRIDGGRRLRVEERGSDPAAAQLVGEHQAERPAARDQDIDGRVGRGLSLTGAQALRRIGRRSVV